MDQVVAPRSQFPGYIEVLACHWTTQSTHREQSVSQYSQNMHELIVTWSETNMYLDAGAIDRETQAYLLRQDRKRRNDMIYESLLI